MRTTTQITQRYKRLTLTLVGLSLIMVVTARANPDITDQTLIAAVESELQTDEGVAAHRVDVEAVNGVVTLSGSVDTLAARVRAVQSAESMRGVRSVVDLIEVKPIQRSDSEIQQDVLAALRADPATDAYEVNVEVQDGAVTLEGTVDSRAEKRLCAGVSMGVKGVKTLDNQLELDLKQVRSSTELKPEIEQLLSAEVRLDDDEIEVSVSGGNVTLTGSVGTPAEQRLARSIAWVTGVRSVDVSELTVEPGMADKAQRGRRYISRPDDEIEKAVQAALVNDPRVWSYNVNVDSDYGTVLLSGIVDNLKAKKAAEQDALHTAGVIRVKNHLRVRPVENVPDETIVERVESALERDSHMDRHELSIACYNGKVHLYGTVDTRFEKFRAEDIAYRTKGVVAVQNSINVNRPWTTKADWLLKEDIEDQLFWSPYVDSDQIDVQVNDGIATLSGRVSSWDEYRRAAANAYEGGANKVVNHLRVM